jgi:hypothetical protein
MAIDGFGPLRLTPARHEGAGNRHVSEMDCDRIVDDASDTARPFAYNLKLR